MTHESLYSRARINALSVKNRLVVAPMTRISATESGTPDARMKPYYERFARGGFGLVITEGIYIDQAWSQTYACQSGLTDAGQAASWREITDAIHSHGSAVVAQIQHSGALSQGNSHRKGAIAPSAIRPKGEQLAFYYGSGKFEVPREITEEEIQAVINSFAETASRAVTEAGFDGVEIHGANGYLLDQFFTDYTNQRVDRWGGDIAHRLALSLAVIRAVREKVGPDVVVGIRLSQAKVNDPFHKWQEGEEGAATVFRLIAESGADYLHLAEYEAWQPAFADNARSLVELARQAAPSLTIIANGSLSAPERAVRMLSQGADFIAIGKGALANPDWPNRVRDGQPLNAFDKNLLAPVADIKPSELF